MNIRQFLIVFVVCAALLFLLHIFSLERPLSPEQVAQAVADYREMETLLHADPIDYEKVETLYWNGIAEILHEVDDTEERKLHFNVEDAMERARDGKIPQIAVHVVEKPIQHAFYRYMIMQLDRLQEGKEEKARRIEKARLCFSVLEPVIRRADQWAGVDGALVGRASAYLEEIGKQNPASPDKERAVRRLETLYKGVSVLKVLEAMDQIETWQHRDKMKALIHMAEAKMHYTILYEDHALRFRKDAVLVLGEFNKLPKEMDTQMIRANLKKAFVDLIPELTADRFEKPVLQPEEEG